MLGHDAREVGLLRDLVRGIELRPSLRPDQLTQDYLRREHLALARPAGNGLFVVCQSAGSAFSELAECLVACSPAMERGTIFANVRTELLAVLKDSFLGRDPATTSEGDVTALHTHFDGWLAQLAKPRHVFIACALSPWAAPRFSVGPATFLFIDDAVGSEFYPPADDLIGRHAFDEMIRLMRENRANWLARVSIEGCEHKRAEEVGALAVDLAITALQLAIPLAWDTRTMSRLDARRGAGETRTLSEVGGHYYWGSSRADEAGLAIGTGTLADILRKTAPTIAAAGARVASFATGQYRLPKLEQAWCDAAYWLHEALAEPSDAIAVAKLETALEVLLSGGSTAGSRRRLETVLRVFYGLGPADPLHTETSMTAEQFAKGVVRDRSRILHGTWPTLNSRLALSRAGMEEFVIAVVRRAALELERYVSTATPADDIDGWLAWVADQPVPTP